MNSNMTRTQLYRAIGFMGILLLSFTILELAARQMNTNRTDLFWKQEAFEAAAPYLETLVLGSSQMEHAIDPQHLPMPTFNAAYGEQDLYYDYQLVKNNVPGCPRLQTIIVGFSYLSFGFDVEQHAGFLAKDYFWEYGIWPRSNNLFRMFVYSSVLINHRTSFFKSLITGKQPGRLLMSSSSTTAEPFPEDNTLLWSGYRFSRATVPEDEQGRKTQELSKLHQAFYDPANILANENYLERLLSIADERSINVLGIIPPFMVGYRAYLPDTIQTDFNNSLTSIRAQHPEFPVYDFSAAPGFGPDDFVDPVHLNAAGGARFTQLIQPLISTASSHDAI